jgi:hypothetical protein
MSKLPEAVKYLVTYAKGHGVKQVGFADFTVAKDYYDEKAAEYGKEKVSLSLETITIHRTVLL